MVSSLDHQLSGIVILDGILPKGHMVEIPGLVICYTLRTGKWHIEIEDLPIENCDLP
jgi:hypothetical protein